MFDYTGPHDYFNETYVNEWASVANSKRPFRPEFFDVFVSELAVVHNRKVLDVGSGPGFLAERVLNGCDVALTTCSTFRRICSNSAAPGSGTSAREPSFTRGVSSMKDGGNRCRPHSMRSYRCKPSTRCAKGPGFQSSMVS